MSLSGVSRMFLGKTCILFSLWSPWGATMVSAQMKIWKTFWVEYCSIFWVHFLGAQTSIPAPKVPWIRHCPFYQVTFACLLFEMMLRVACKYFLTLQKWQYLKKFNMVSFTLTLNAFIGTLIKGFLQQTFTSSKKR